MADDIIIKGGSLTIESENQGKWEHPNKTGKILSVKVNGEEMWRWDDRARTQPTITITYGSTETAQSS